jgi:maleate isomerase
MTATTARAHRIGLIVPSSNTTMETELPQLLQRQMHQHKSGGVRFTLHSARLRATQVTPEAHRGMNDSAEAAVDALCDAQVDAILHGFLVGAMSGGRRCICDTHSRLAERAATPTRRPSVVTSAAALVSGLKALKASRVTLIAPYRKPLTAQVGATLAEYGIDVVQSRSLEIIDNVAVGRLDQAKLLSIASQLDYSSSDALVLSACVQMPSLDVIEEAEQKLGLPVISAVTASVFELLNQLDIEPAIANAGSLLRAATSARHQAVV